ncbi:MAG: YbhB/YbcL family Raf kinase inhibitor-like protein [Acidimicrobiia bacterium]|nr:YbhB/YbcL family Raf kinase inhibitor-like protein [Acidimicrobiia bacterium]
MNLTTDSLAAEGPIPAEFAFGVLHPESHVTLGPNKNPAFSWSGLPAGTRSLVLVCHDRDVPSRGDDVNQEGRTVPADLPRVDFFHWTLVDLSPERGSIASGEFSEGVIPRGKPGPSGPGGTRQGLNSYTELFAGDADMEGDYFGYDGPCPPWNDEIAHHYIFTLYALDVERCPIEGTFRAPEVLEAIRGHVLGEASVGGIYSLNPDVPA